MTDGEEDRKVEDEIVLAYVLASRLNTEILDEIVGVSDRQVVAVDSTSQPLLAEHLARLKRIKAHAEALSDALSALCDRVLAPEESDPDDSR